MNISTEKKGMGKEKFDGQTCTRQWMVTRMCDAGQKEYIINEEIQLILIFMHLRQEAVL